MADTLFIHFIMHRNFVIAGGRNGNPAKVSMTLDPIKLEDRMGIAVKSIAYGEVNSEDRSNRNKVLMGCLYLNIVENSFINGKRSRIICVCPFEYKNGYSFFEFMNPTYVPVEVREFSDISLSILDFDGQFIPFNNKFDTVVTLEMRPLQYK